MKSIFLGKAFSIENDFLGKPFSPQPNTIEDYCLFPSLLTASWSKKFEYIWEGHT